LNLQAAFSSIMSTIRPARADEEVEDNDFIPNEGGSNNESKFICRFEGSEMPLSSAVSKLEGKYGQTLNSISAHLPTTQPPPSKSSTCPSLTHVTLSRNRLGPLTCLSLLSLLLLPPCKAHKGKRRRVKMRLTSKLSSSRRSRKRGGVESGNKYVNEDLRGRREWEGTGCTITHLDVGFNPLGSEGTDLIVKARGRNIEMLRIENTKNGKDGVGIEGEDRQDTENFTNQDLTSGDDNQGGEYSLPEATFQAVTIDDPGVTVTDFPGTRRAVNPKKWRVEG